MQAIMGCTTVQASELGSFQLPPDTRSYRCVPHDIARNHLIREFDRRGLTIKGETWGISAAKKGRNGNDVVYGGPAAVAFGVFNLDSGHEGSDWSIGMINSYDKSRALSLVIGRIVWFCSNGLWAGDQVTYRKHTSGIDVAEETYKAVSKAMGRFVAFDVFVDRLRDVEVRESDFHAIFTDSVECGVLKGAGPANLVNAWKHAQAPKGFDDFQGRLESGGYSIRNGWNLHGCYTELLKSVNPTSTSADFMGRHAALNRIFVNRLNVPSPVAPIIDKSLSDN